jgi:hypothetical protein
MHSWGPEARASEAEPQTNELYVEWPTGEAPKTDRSTLADPGEREPASEPAEPLNRESAEPEVSGELLSTALLEYAREDLAKGWAHERQDSLPDVLLAEGMQRYETLVLNSPESIGRELGTRENKREEALRDAETGGLFALLASLESGEAGPLPNLVRNRAEFEKYFQRDSNEEVAISGVGLTHDQFTEMVDGSTLTFPAGVFEVSALARYWDPIPRDITIRGSGMNTTLLILDDLSSRSQVKNFRLENCTVFCPGGVFDLRREPATATFQNVRITGFDTGAGGSNAIFSKKGMALSYVDCVFAGGYGRNPGGNLMRSTSASFLARFDGCRFERMNLNLARVHPGATVVFSLCTFDEIRDRHVQDSAGSNPGLVLEQCTFLPEANPRPENDELRRDLNDLFPNWKAEIER